MRPCSVYGFVLGERFDVDHIYPKRMGGGDHLENLNPSCPLCNRWKSTYTVEEFRREIGQQVERTLRKSPGLRMALDCGAVVIQQKPIVFFSEMSCPRKMNIE